MIATVFSRNIRVLIACLLVGTAACGDDDDSTDKADAGVKGDHHEHPTNHEDAAAPDASDDGEANAAADASGPEPGSPTFDGVFRDVITGGGCNAGPLCHGGSAGMLRMDTRDAAYEGLVGVQAKGTNLADTDGDDCKDTHLVRVVPKDPDSSLVMQKIDPPGGTPPCGTIMPPIGVLMPEQIEQVRTWIENGAKDD